MQLKLIFRGDLQDVEEQNGETAFSPTNIS